MSYTSSSSSNPASKRAKASLSSTVNGYGALRSVLETACDKAGCSLGDLTVLSAQVDPYRLDTRSSHRDSQWLAQQLDRAIGKKRRIHWRGLHYVLVSTSNLVKPNGDIYVNNDDNWTWLINVAGKAARWLGYIDFERITDNRNAEPFIHHKASVKPKALVTVGIDITIPDVSDMEPTPVAEGFEPRQAFHFVIFGEKASLEDVVLPIARSRTHSTSIALRLAYGLTTGEIDLGKVTCSQACAFTGVKRPALAAERRKHRPAKKQPTNGNGNSGRVLYRRALSDADADAIVAQYPELFLKAFDRFTQPKFAFAAE